MSKPRSEHTIIKTDTNPFGESRIWCSCGARCNPGIRSTAMETWQQHLGKAKRGRRTE